MRITKSRYSKILIQVTILIIFLLVAGFLNLPSNPFLGEVKDAKSLIALEDRVSESVRWAQVTFDDFFEFVSKCINAVDTFFHNALSFLPIYEVRLGSNIVLNISALGIAFMLFTWFVSGYKYGISTFFIFQVFVSLGYWEAVLSTFSLVLTASLLSICIGFPFGVIMARSDALETLLKPVLDFMQSFPPYIYLVPAVIFFGLGAAPGVVATVIFAVPPPAKLTNLGIREVPDELIEAGKSFGCNTFQLLYKVELPRAFPTILVGINQCIMMSLGMVIIAALIGAGGLGAEVIVGIQRLWIGKGVVSGFLVVLLAIWLDRVSQSFKKERR